MWKISIIRTPLTHHVWVQITRWQWWKHWWWVISQWLRLCFIPSIVRLHPTFTFIQVGDGEKISGLHKKWSDKKKKWTIYETVSLLECKLFTNSKFSLLLKQRQNRSMFTEICLSWKPFMTSAHCVMKFTHRTTGICSEESKETISFSLTLWSVWSQREHIVSQYNTDVGTT